MKIAGRIAWVFLATIATPLEAQTTTPDLRTATLEELMNVRITAASRREETVAEAPAAVYVISNEAIRRSGLTTVPELLRLAPGVQVARINANKWAVSIRGFNGLYSNKLLVLVDGRSVYNRLFSGVLWDAEDLVLEDIDRIEIVRGPGAVSWGANAVNGVINIVTRSAADTTGTLVRVSAGTFEPGLFTARYGATAGATSFRVYGQWSHQGASRLLEGHGAGDEWRRATFGLRLDRTQGAHSFVMTANGTRGRADALWLVPSGAEPAAESIMERGAALGRWTFRPANAGEWQLQAAFDADRRDEPVASFRRRMGEVDLQYHVRAGRRHDIVAGGALRIDRERLDGKGAFYSLNPPAVTDHVLSAFAQDQMAITSRLVVTTGARLEHDGLAGWGFQPTVRMLFDGSSRQHLWFAASRALRTLSFQERSITGVLPVDGAVPVPTFMVLSGNPELPAETLTDVETGYRVALGRATAVSVTAFAGRYGRLRTQEPGEPAVQVGPQGPYVTVPLRYESLGTAGSTGIEIDAQWAPLPRLRIDGSLTGFKLTADVVEGSRDASAAGFDGDAPSLQAQVHVAVDLPQKLLLDLRLFHVGALRNAGVPGYTRGDARVELPVTRQATVAVVGQNLLSSSHVEFTGASAFLTATRVPRSVRVVAFWRFR